MALQSGFEKNVWLANLRKAARLLRAIACSQMPHSKPYGRTTTRGALRTRQSVMPLSYMPHRRWADVRYRWEKCNRPWSSRYVCPGDGCVRLSEAGDPFYGAQPRCKAGARRGSRRNYFLQREHAPTCKEHLTSPIKNAELCAPALQLRILGIHRHGITCSYRCMCMLIV